MKKQIVAYVTGVVDSYTKTIEMLKVNRVFNTSLNSLVAVKNEFSDLLDYVVDIPEEPVTDTYLEINRLRDILAKQEVDSEEQSFEIILLRQRVAELEEETEELSVERCELNQVNDSLFKQIKILKRDFNLKQITCNELKNKLT